MNSQHPSEVPLPLWSAKDTWQWLNVSRTLFFRLIKDPSFPKPYRFGRATRWDPNAVMAWLESQAAK